MPRKIKPGRKKLSDALLLAGQSTEIRDMYAAATKSATDMRTRAGEIEDAAHTIASITKDHDRSADIDGPAWERAERILRDAGIKVPNPGHLVWG